jgi:hypothetical protein
MQVPTDLIREISGYTKTEYAPLVFTNRSPFLSATDSVWTWTFEGSLESDFITDIRTSKTPNGEVKVYCKQRFLKSNFNKYIRKTLRKMIGGEDDADEGEAFSIYVGQAEAYYYNVEHDHSEESIEEEVNKCMEFIEDNFGVIFKF